MITRFTLLPGPYQRTNRSTTQIMLMLCAALVFVALFGIVYQFTTGMMNGVYGLLIIVVSLVATLLVDLLTAVITKQKDLKKFVITNYSYVTALIFALIVPASTNLWVVAVGAIFSTVIAKAVFGGFGRNIMNPAIAGRIFVGITFASFFTAATISTVTTGATFMADTNLSWNNITTMVGAEGFDWLKVLFGFYNGAIGETATIPILVACGVLSFFNVIDYRQPLFYLGTIALIALFIGLSNGYNAGEYVLLHLSMGGVMFGAVFMLTDPVTSSTTSTGRIISATLAGLLTMLIRTKANFAEGCMYSIALVNVFQPLIDSFITGNSRTNLSKNIIAVTACAVIAVGVGSLGGYYPDVAPVSSGDTTTTISTPSTPPADPFDKKVPSAAFTESVADGTVSITATIELYKGLISKVTYAGGIGSDLFTVNDAYTAKYITPLIGKTVAEATALDLFSAAALPTEDIVADATGTANCLYLAIKDGLSKAPELYGTGTSTTLNTWVYIDLDADGKIATVEIFNDKGIEGEYFPTIAAFNDKYVTPLTGLTPTEALALPAYLETTPETVSTGATHSGISLFNAIKDALGA